MRKIEIITYAKQTTVSFKEKNNHPPGENELIKLRKKQQLKMGNDA